MTTVQEIFETMDYGPAPESDAEARQWLASHQGQFGHFIDGAWTQPGKAFEVIDPSTGTSLARVSQGTKADVDAAIAAARRALPDWRGLSGHARA
jgi:aldehyde dehydrogenase (NAD+)